MGGMVQGIIGEIYIWIEIYSVFMDVYKEMARI